MGQAQPLSRKPFDLPADADECLLDGVTATQLSIHEIRVSEGQVLALEGDEEKQSAQCRRLCARH